MVVIASGNIGYLLRLDARTVAEGEGFEPPSPCGPPVFKTGAFNRSAIPPAA